MKIDRFFLPFAKVEEQDDGTLLVTGIASSESLDAHGEIIRAAAIKAALPDYFKFGTGNLREMHQPIAAGTVEDADVSEDGRTYISARVVDDAAIKKVRTNTYKGFSIGGQVQAKEGNVITALSLNEISLVDRPANPDAVLTMWKAEDMNVKKSLYGVSRLASLLQEVKWLADSETYEAAVNGTASPVPEACKVACQALAAALVTMVGDAVADMKSADAGAEAETKSADPEQDPSAEEADAQEEAGKADTGGDIAKIAGGMSDLAKAFDALKGLPDQIKAMEARLAKIESQPAAPKAALRVVAKNEDTGGAEDMSDDDVLKAIERMSPMDRTMLLTKAAQRTPVSIR